MSEATALRVMALFSGDAARAAEQLLVHQCGSNLPYCEDTDAAGMERIRFAALKASGGDLAKLRTAIELGKIDWRDLLVEAGFADDPQEHERWDPGRLVTVGEERDDC